MDLISKYNTAVPRYTSYPTVPAWSRTPDQEQWREQVKKTFLATNKKHGISLYIHLPFCESLCTYCACNTRITVNHQVEHPYIVSLIKEWQLYLKVFGKRPKIREIHLGGGTPTFFSADNLQILLQNILLQSDIGEDADLSFEAHPDNTTTQHLQTLYDLGFRRVSFGIQDFDPVVQEAIHRKQTVQQVTDIVEEARRIGYHSINFDLVYGLPFQTQKSISHTLEQVKYLRPERIAFYSYAHVPWIKPGQRKFTEKDLPVDQAKRALYETGLRIFKESGYTNIGLDHFALPGDLLFNAVKHKTLHRNFMGYTPHSTKLLIGLGASSISDTGTCLSQNSKGVESYQEAINKGEFPIHKGHLLNEEDTIIRQHILNVMCRHETFWQNNSTKGKVLHDGLERLSPLEKDGLVKLYKNKLLVTPLGMTFLRNICFCLDARHWNYSGKKNAFSSAV